MSVINQHIKYWLARLEIKAAATHRPIGMQHTTGIPAARSSRSVRQSGSGTRPNLLRFQIQRRYGLLMRRSRAAITI
jgi:hypothetical protein